MVKGICCNKTPSGFNKDGSYNIEGTYEKLGVNTKCKWCEFADKPEICDKGKL